ncbi:hypothetical protein OpiT1DRAFT_03991 [Opitutaceae bacterium TAV1]|nr:hypothetical protein OpiT1DRAFT_03991 [Opitutaceae bacterium TAV1]
MLLKHLEKPIRKPARTRFPGICRTAAAMGIRRETLWKYLTGHWQMPAATRVRYERAIAEHGGER